jgi:hypothetical protein
MFDLDIYDINWKNNSYYVAHRIKSKKKTIHMIVGENDTIFYIYNEW